MYSDGLGSDPDLLEEKLKLLLELSDYVSRGIGLYVADRLSTPQKAVQLVMDGEGSYMADFVKNEKGKLTEIRYDRISIC